MVEGSNYFEIKGGKVIIDSNEILIDGQVIRLTPKEKGVLLLLYSNRGRTVSRSQLLETVWGDSLGNDSGLTQAISRLRQILNDDPKHPKLIKTIPKMGYQLLLNSDNVIPQDIQKTIRSNGYENLSISKRIGIGIILILILVIIFLLIFNVKIRIEQLPAFVIL